MLERHTIQAIRPWVSKEPLHLQGEHGGGDGGGHVSFGAPVGM